MGYRAFAVAAPRAWNSLPDAIRRILSRATFKRSNILWKLTFVQCFYDILFITFSPRVVDIVKCPWSNFFLFTTLILTILHYVTEISPLYSVQNCLWPWEVFQFRYDIVMRTFGLTCMHKLGIFPELRVRKGFRQRKWSSRSFKVICTGAIGCHFLFVFHCRLTASLSFIIYTIYNNSSNVLFRIAVYKLD